MEITGSECDAHETASSIASICSACRTGHREGFGWQVFLFEHLQDSRPDTGFFSGKGVEDSRTIYFDKCHCGSRITYTQQYQITPPADHDQLPDYRPAPKAWL